jgi:peptidoglycan/LPS O-acetylase OafA/YrhL
MPEVFRYGYLGVELFFIISGFVIALTLSKCSTFVEFVKKRFVRLIPGMIICSFSTFLFVMFFDSQNIFPHSKSIQNLLFSNTFISPQLINNLIGTNFHYIDGAYWSLWAELQFYFFAGLIYFFSPKGFLKNYLFFAFFGAILFFIFISNFGLNFFGDLIGKNIFFAIRKIFQVFTYFEYSLWFLIGVIINKIYFGDKRKKILYLLIAIFLFQMILLGNIYAIVFTIFMMIIFLLFLHKPVLINFLANKVVARVGVASYSIYLIHENIGVLFINKMSKYFGDFNWILPIFLIIVISVFGVYSYKFFENPFGKKLASLFFQNKK